MKNLLSKFMKEQRGDVVQYIIVLAVIAIILAFAFPKIRDKMGKATNDSMNNMNTSFSNVSPNNAP